MTHAQFDALQVGDLVRMPSGIVRIVRHKGTRTATFAIRHCSWTRRCYTVYTKSELLRWETVPAKRRALNSPMDKAIVDAIGRHDRPIGCCDVEGVM